MLPRRPLASGARWRERDTQANLWCSVSSLTDCLRNWRLAAFESSRLSIQKCSKLDTSMTERTDSKLQSIFILLSPRSRTDCEKALHAPVSGLAVCFGEGIAITRVS